MQNRIAPLLLILVVFACSACRKNDASKQAEEDEEIILTYISDNNLDAVATGSGLYYVIENEGSGDHPTVVSDVTVAYTGELVSGVVFDQSSSQGATFNLSGVIQGWQEGIPLFKEGGNGLLLIPSALGYGNQPTGSIPANSVLIFEVELLDVD